MISWNISSLKSYPPVPTTIRLEYEYVYISKRCRRKTSFPYDMLKYMQRKFIIFFFLIHFNTMSVKKNKIHYKTCCHHFNRKNIWNAFTMMTKTSIFLFYLSAEMNDIGLVQYYITKNMFCQSIFSLDWELHISILYVGNGDQYGDWYLSEYLVLPS